MLRQEWRNLACIKWEHDRPMKPFWKYPFSCSWIHDLVTQPAIERKGKQVILFQAPRTGHKVNYHILQVGIWLTKIFFMDWHPKSLHTLKPCYLPSPLQTPWPQPLSHHHLPRAFITEYSARLTSSRPAFFILLSTSFRRNAHSHLSVRSIVMHKTMILTDFWNFYLSVKQICNWKSCPNVRRERKAQNVNGWHSHTNCVLLLSCR